MLLPRQLSKARGITEHDIACQWFGVSDIEEIILRFGGSAGLKCSPYRVV